MKIEPGQRIKLKNLTGKDKERFTEGQIVTFKGFKKQFGKDYMRVEESEHTINITKLTNANGEEQTR